MKTILNDLKDFLVFDLSGSRPRLSLEDLRKIPLEISLNVLEEEDGLAVVAPEFPGLVIHSPNKEQLANRLQDALYVYFDIPSYYAKRLPSKNMIVQDNEGKIVSKSKKRVGQEIFENAKQMKFVNE